MLILSENENNGHSPAFNTKIIKFWLTQRTTNKFSLKLLLHTKIYIQVYCLELGKTLILIPSRKISNSSNYNTHSKTKILTAFNFFLFWFHLPVCVFNDYFFPWQICVCIYTHIHTHTHIIYIYIYIYIYIQTHIHIYIYIYIYTYITHC